MATVRITYNDGSIGEWTKVPEAQAQHVDDYLMAADRGLGFPMNYEVVQ